MSYFYLDFYSNITHSITNIILYRGSSSVGRARITRLISVYAAIIKVTS